MVSHVTLTILFGYAAAFWCLDSLPGAGKIQAPPRSAFVPRLAAGALLPAVLAAFVLTSLLLFAHVRALGGANAAAARRRHLLDRLANATMAAAAAALLAGGVLRLVTDGNPGSSDDDIGWLSGSGSAWSNWYAG